MKQFTYKEYKPTYQVFAEQMQAGIPKLGWELYDSRPVWRITNLKKVIDALYAKGDTALLSCAHLKTKSYIKYHYGRAADKVSEILKTTPITDRKKIQSQGLKAEHLLMVNAKAARELLGDDYADCFEFSSQKLAKQVFCQ